MILSRRFPPFGPIRAGAAAHNSIKLEKSGESSFGWMDGHERMGENNPNSIIDVNAINNINHIRKTGTFGVTK